MKNIVLKRISFRDDGTFGVLMDEDLPFCLTVELPWLNNEQNVSCIPSGVYVCKRIISPTFGETFEITGVPNRTHVLFHVANTVDDLKGCVGLGEMFGRLGSKTAVQMSKQAFWELMERTAGLETFRLTIKECV